MSDNPNLRGSPDNDLYNHSQSWERDAMKDTLRKKHPKASDAQIAAAVDYARVQAKPSEKRDLIVYHASIYLGVTVK